jgi:Sigma-70, region 4
VRLAPLPLSELPIADKNQSPLNEYQSGETGAQLHAGLVRLPEKYRNVILLRDIEDLSVSEVAGRLGLTIPGGENPSQARAPESCGITRTIDEVSAGVAAWSEPAYGNCKNQAVIHVTTAKEAEARFD